jgi:MarR family transcriptional regulator, 2-MHQ and catechol-resistance regulon repressor
MEKVCSDSSSSIEIWSQMVRTYRAMDRAISNLLAEEGLTIPQTEILAILKKKGPLAQQSLAEGLSVTKGNVAQVVDRLHKSGMILRTEIAENRRANLLKITDKGRKILEKILPKFIESLNQLFAAFPTDRGNRLLEDLRELEEACKNSS